MMNRISFVDYLRIMTCFMVMLIHASENFYIVPRDDGMTQSYVPNESTRFWIAFYDGFIGRTAVPLFMIASAFLLVPMKPGTDMFSFYGHRFLRILPPFILFIIIYTFLPLAWGGLTWKQSKADLRIIAFSFPSFGGHLWFMYPLISLYLIIPVVSPWLERSKHTEELAFIAIFVITSFQGWIEKWIGQGIWGEALWNKFTAMWYHSGFIGYLVMAHYIRFHLNWTKKVKLLAGFGLFIFGSIFTGWAFWIKAVPGVQIFAMIVEWAWDFCHPNLIISTFGIFIVLSCIEKPAPAWISEIAQLTYGMYLMHMCFLAPISSWLVPSSDKPRVHVSIVIPIIAVLSFLCSMITTKILSYIPGARFIVGYESHFKKK